MQSELFLCLLFFCLNVLTQIIDIIENKIGPKMEPWGPLWYIKKVRLTWTHRVGSTKSFLNHSMSLVRNQLRSFSSNSWFAESITLDRSTNKAAQWLFFLSMVPIIWFNTTVAAVMVVWPVLKPDWEEFKNIIIK